MRKVLYISFMFCLLAIQSWAQADKADLDFASQAEMFYETKNYKKAIEAYEKLVLKGYSSWKLYYNLGNAYYKNNQLGKAIYNYERAKKIDPKNEDVLNNITLAYSKTVDKIEVKENFFVNAVKTNVLSSFSTATWAWFTIGISALLFIFLYLFFAGPSTFIRRASFFVSLVLVVVFFIVYFLGKSAVNAKVQTSFAVITSPIVKIFPEPSATSASKFSLHEGTRVKIMEYNADWILIKLENGNEGWLKTNDVGVF